MKRAFLLLICACLVFLCGCESFQEVDGLDGLVKVNDLSITLKAAVDNGHQFAVEKILDGEDGYFMRFVVRDEFSLRGKVSIYPGRPYRIVFVMRNASADPVIGYSFWKDSVTQSRQITLAGENGNPPVSKTQETYAEWTRFEETFMAEEGEGEFMVTLYSGPGVFDIREIWFEDVTA